LIVSIDYTSNPSLLGICKCICTREGLLIDNVVVNKSLLATWLEHLTDVDWSENTIYSLLNPESSMIQRINALLSPKDMQDVPRAIKLLSLTADLRNLDTSSFDPSESNTHRALSLLGEMLDALIEPFINPDFTISEQITSLVKFSHLLCALFLKHETDFMPPHLYSDLQCMVRTAIYRVAHTKILDPELKVLLCLLGDDVLEVLFGRTRMIGGHSPNVDVDKLRRRFGSAIRLDAIFEAYPEWEQRPIRLKLKRSRDADHLSPRNWRGDLRAITCDLHTCWTKGVAQAEMILKKHGYTIDFSEHFRDWRTRGVDLLRPKGGKYPGISLEVDRSLGEAAEVQEEEPDDFGFRLFDGKKALEKEERSAVNQEVHSIWMDLEEGKPPGHKKTILRLFTDPTLDIDYGASHDHLLRVRYFSIGGNHSNCDSKLQDQIYRASTGGDLFALGSLYATAVCIEQKVSIAILQCTSLKCASQYLGQAPLDEITLPDSGYDVSGQILLLYPIFQNSGNAQAITWVWNSKFVSLEAAKSSVPQSSTTTRIHHLSFAINGSLVLPLRSHQYKSILVTDLPAEFAQDIAVDKTWIISNNDIQAIKLSLLQRLQSNEIIRSKIVIYGGVREGAFPYTSTNPSSQYPFLFLGSDFNGL
jgi:hypothetical protein